MAADNVGALCTGCHSDVKTAVDGAKTKHLPVAGGHGNGIPAYPEYVIAASAAPSGMSAETVHTPSVARAGGIGLGLKPAVAD